MLNLAFIYYYFIVIGITMLRLKEVRQEKSPLIPYILQSVLIMASKGLNEHDHSSL